MNRIFLNWIANFKKDKNMKLLDKIFQFFTSQDDYKWGRGQVVYFADSEYNNIKTMKINHRMSGWDTDDWEYYHCSCIDPKITWEKEMSEEVGINAFGESVCEISQKHLFYSKNEAEKYLIKNKEN